MIELLQEYWKPFFYSDGYHITGLAMTMWLLSASICIGFLVSIIGLADLVKAAQDAGKSTYQLFLFLVIAALIYLAITSASNFVLRRLERHYGAGAREAVR